MTVLEPVIIKLKYVNTVPPMPPKKFEELKLNIKEEGLKYKIAVNKDYVLLDGHHRYKACQELGILITEDNIDIRREFDDPLKEEKFVRYINQVRRHLNLFQEAEALVELVELEAEDAAKRQRAGKKITLSSDELEVCKGQARDIAIKKNGAALSPSTFTRAVKVIREASPEVKQRLREGKTEINTEYQAIRKQEEKQKLLAEASTNTAKLPDGIRLIHADFTKIGEDEIPCDSVPCIFTDPPYEEKDLQVFHELGKLAMRVLLPGGSLVTYLGEGYTDIVIEKIKASGLKFWTIITIELKGHHTNVHFRKVFAYCKTLLWFVKGDKLREGIPLSYMPNLVVSSRPEKLLHKKGWGQSPVEAEHIIKYLTFPGEMALDPMMGEGTTGIAAINQGRQFIGLEIDEDEFKQADLNIRKHSPGRRGGLRDDRVQIH